MVLLSRPMRCTRVLGDDEPLDAHELKNTTMQGGPIVGTPSARDRRSSVSNRRETSAKSPASYPTKGCAAQDKELVQLHLLDIQHRDLLSSLI
jgi:hypothetical protein